MPDTDLDRAYMAREILLMSHAMCAVVGVHGHAQQWANNHGRGPERVSLYQISEDGETCVVIASQPRPDRHQAEVEICVTRRATTLAEAVADRWHHGLNVTTWLSRTNLVEHTVSQGEFDTAFRNARRIIHPEEDPHA